MHDTFVGGVLPSRNACILVIFHRDSDSTRTLHACRCIALPLVVLSLAQLPWLKSPSAAKGNLISILRRAWGPASASIVWLRLRMRVLPQCGELFCCRYDRSLLPSGRRPLDENSSLSVIIGKVIFQGVCWPAWRCLFIRTDLSIWSVRKSLSSSCFAFALCALSCGRQHFDTGCVLARTNRSFQAMLVHW